MSDTIASDYNISPRDAKELLGVVLMPHDIRIVILTKYMQDRGADALANLFSQFIGMANSVVENTRDSMWVFGMTKAKMTPKEAEDINFPTLFGALNGIKLAEGVDQEATCHGCACRLGSLANQSPATTCDVDWCLAGDDKFYCHEDMDADGQPTRPCVGVQFHRKRAGI